MHRCCGPASVPGMTSLVFNEETPLLGLACHSVTSGESQPASTRECAGKTLLIPGLHVCLELALLTSPRSPGAPLGARVLLGEEGGARHGGTCWCFFLRRRERHDLRGQTLPVLLWTEQTWEPGSTLTHTGLGNPCASCGPPASRLDPRCAGPPRQAQATAAFIDSKQKEKY